MDITITNRSVENNNPMKDLDLQSVAIDQTIALKMSESEKALAEKDNIISSLHTNMMNSQNNNYILSNQCKNIMKKTKSVNDTCICFNTSFTHFCERLNKLGDTVDKTRTRQNDVMTLVDKTTSTFQEKYLSISVTVDKLLKQVNKENIRTKQDFEMLENRYSLDIVAFKINLQECSNEIEYLKKENNFLLEKLKDEKLKLNEEKETVLNLDQHFKTELKAMEAQNVLLYNQNKSINEHYDEIRTNNQILYDELCVLKNSLNENKKQLDMQSNIIKEQSELCDNLKIFEELHDKLKKDNFILKEQNVNLEQINTNLVDDISSNKLSQHEFQEATENKFKDMCENYDNVLKLQDKRLKDIIEKLKFHKANEISNQTGVIELKQEIETSNITITGLQKKLQANYLLIPELQNKIDDLSTNLVNSYQTFKDSTKELVTEKNKLEKEKIELENQRQENCGQIEKRTANYLKYKSKAKQLYIEVMRLKYQCSQSELKKKIQLPPTLNTIKILSDGVNIVDDVNMVKFNDRDVSNMNVSKHSTSNVNVSKHSTSSKMNVSNVSEHSNSNKSFQNSNFASLKRYFSPLKHIGSSKVKKHITSVHVAATHVSLKKFSNALRFLCKK